MLLRRLEQEDWLRSSRENPSPAIFPAPAIF
jgi:hypothetical protein